MDDTRMLRWTGIAGIIGAMLLFTGDMFLFGSWLSGSDALAENWRLMARFSPVRLMIGGMFGPVGSIFYVLGCWHFYLALKSGGKSLSFLVFSNYALGIIIGGAFHAASPCLGILFHAQQDLSQELFTRLLTSMRHYLDILFLLAQSFGGIGALLFILLVLFRPTRYPRWMIVFTPPVIFVTSMFGRYIPAPLGGNIRAGYLHLGFTLIFGVSLKLLWHGGRPVTRS